MISYSKSIITLEYTTFSTDFNSFSKIIFYTIVSLTFLSRFKTTMISSQESDNSNIVEIFQRKKMLRKSHHVFNPKLINVSV